MPRSSRKRSRKASKKRSTHKVKRSRKLSTRSKIHTFKGTMNGGTLIAPASSSAITTWGGIYTIDLNNLPIYSDMATNFDFVRLNSLKFELMPRGNVNQIGGTSNTYASGTIVVGVDEVPMSSTSSTASTWATNASQDSGVTEATAQACVYATPDYIRGMENSTEVEVYKRVSKTFVPATYVLTTLVAGNFNNGGSNTNSYEQLKKKWFNTQVFSSSASAQASPLFFGIMYAFSAAAPSTQTPLYDVRVHYSVSFRRLRGT